MKNIFVQDGKIIEELTFEAILPLDFVISINKKEYRVTGRISEITHNFPQNKKLEVKYIVVENEEVPEASTTN